MEKNSELLFYLRCYEKSFIDIDYGFIVPRNLKSECKIVFGKLYESVSDNFLFDICLGKGYEFFINENDNIEDIDIKKFNLSQIVYWININYPGRGYTIYLYLNLIFDDSFPQGFISDQFNMRWKLLSKGESNDVSKLLLGRFSKNKELTSSEIMKQVLDLDLDSDEETDEESDEQFDEYLKYSKEFIYEINKFDNPKIHERIQKIINNDEIQLCSIEKDLYDDFTSTIFIINDENVFINCINEDLKKIILNNLNKELKNNSEKKFKLLTKKKFKIPDTVKMLYFAKVGQYYFRSGEPIKNYHLKFDKNMLNTNRNETLFNQNFKKSLIDKIKNKEMKKHLNYICSYDVFVIPYKCIFELFIEDKNEKLLVDILNKDIRDTYFKH